MNFSREEIKYGKPRMVTFSPVSTAAVIPRDSTTKVHYSLQDIEAFKQETAMNVRALRHILASTPAAEVGNEVLLHCIGVENFLSQDVMGAAMAAKSAHIRSVLEEHQGQVQRGTGSVERLALVSMQSSLRARIRAEMVALGYSRLAE